MFIHVFFFYASFFPCPSKWGYSFAPSMSAAALAPEEPRALWTLPFGKKKKGNPKSKLLSLSDSLIRPLALWMSRREAFLSNVQRVMQKSERILNKHCFIDGALARTSVPQFLIPTRIINLTTFAYICNHKHFMIFFCFGCFKLTENGIFPNPLDLSS